MYVLQPTKLLNIISTPLDWTTKYNLNHISIGEVGIKIGKFSPMKVRLVYKYMKLNAKLK
jgi:hypothetical protein